YASFNLRIAKVKQTTTNGIDGTFHPVFPYYLQILFYSFYRVWQLFWGILPIDIPDKESIEAHEGLPNTELFRFAFGTNQPGVKVGLCLVCNSKLVGFFVCQNKRIFDWQYVTVYMNLR
ncbi:MAG: hypothetical protein MZV63_15745, partial [Marinilabiliales bacterium]|nr:hypothetical protein [Marinilabiliales bacterium]